MIVAHLSRPGAAVQALGIAALACCLALSGTHAQPLPEPAEELPGRTDAGRWDGTWWFKYRDAHVALWLRTENGKPELKLRYLRMVNGEGFETDWKGHSDYTTRDATGRFDLRVLEADANVIRADWDWQLDLGTSGRVEKARVVLYRQGYGRALRMQFGEFERTVFRQGRQDKTRLEQGWTFRKGSRRLVRWEELPF